MQDAGLRVEGAGLRVEGAGCRVQGAGGRVQGAGLRTCPGSSARASGRMVKGVVRTLLSPCPDTPSYEPYPQSDIRLRALPIGSQHRGFLIDNLVVRIHLIIEMVLVDRPCAMGV